MPISERDLEAPFARLLEKGLARELTQNAHELEVRNTARGGLGAGQWAKPDLVVASVCRYLSQPMPELSLYGFELKTRAGFDLSSIYQAAAHTRFVHFAFVVVHHPMDGVWPVRLSQVRLHAEELGIGVIRLESDDDAGPCEVVLQGRRHRPHPQSVDHFIEERMPDLVKWVRAKLKA